jgi:membrane protease subunit HflK
MEDRATRINQARSVVAREIPLARGRAAETLEQARAYRDRIVQEAVGRADRFVSRQSEYANAAELTRARLYFEMMDTVLPRLRKYIKPPLAAGGEMEIWFTRPQNVNALPIPAIRDRERAAQRAR